MDNDVIVGDNTDDDGDGSGAMDNDDLTGNGGSDRTVTATARWNSNGVMDDYG
jgi:hypothetical protein